MTKEELLALGLTEEQAVKVVDDYGKNYVAKSQFNAKLSELKEATTAKSKAESELLKVQKELTGFKESGVGTAADVTKLKDELNDFKKNYEAEKTARIHSEIMGKTIDALTKANAVDPQEFAKIISQGVEINEDGTYGYKKSDGTVGSIEDYVTEYLKGKPWAVKNVQNSGSNSPSTPAGGSASEMELAQKELEAAIGI